MRRLISIWIEGIRFRRIERKARILHEALHDARELQRILREIDCNCIYDSVERWGRYVDDDEEWEYDMDDDDKDWGDESRRE